MKKKLTLFFSFNLLCLVVANAQTTKVTKIDHDYNLEEKYHVLKADKPIKDGPYEAHTIYSNVQLTVGAYKNGQKDGLWKQYDIGHRLIEEGSYKDGQKTGIWSTYDWKGNLTSQYDHTSAKLLLYKPTPPDTSRSFYVINGTDTVQTDLDRAPVYLDGTQMALRIIMSTIRYPVKARINNIQGIVLVGFTVGADGQISGYHIVKSLGGGCDEEALTVVKKLNGDWLSGVLNGKAVAVMYILPIKFSSASH